MFVRMQPGSENGMTFEANNESKGRRAIENMRGQLIDTTIVMQNGFGDSRPLSAASKSSPKPPLKKSKEKNIVKQ